MADHTIYEVKTTRVRLKLSEPLQCISDPETAVSILKSIYADLDADQEHVTILCLNKAHKVTGFKVLFTGGQDESIVDLKVLYRNALMLGATALVIAHNHPSGRTEPSTQDLDMTRKVLSAGEMLGIRVLDHIILGGDQWLSFREKGLI